MIIHKDLIHKALTIKDKYDKNQIKVFITGEERDLVINLINKHESEEFKILDELNQEISMIYDYENINKLMILASYKVKIIVIENHNMEIFQDGGHGSYNIWTDFLGITYHYFKHIKGLNHADMILIYILSDLSQSKIDTILELVDSKLVTSMIKTLSKADDLVQEVKDTVILFELKLSFKHIQQFRNLSFRLIKDLFLKKEVSNYRKNRFRY
ncbi:MAG: hypothetical protein K8Q99_06785 [Acholeplasmataceae bacterium]|nr:hypothetical protein [Acholeplasmataceae bacterium]